MPTIKFTATPELPFDIAHLGYKAGDVLEMNDASARRWVRRGVAVYHVGVAKEMPRMEGDKPWKVIPIDDDVDDIPIALDPVLMPEPANEIGNSDEKPAEAIADVEETADDESAIEPAIFAGHEPTVAADESPKRRGRKARES